MRCSALQGYGFVEFRTEEDADYAIKIINMVKLFGKPLRVNKSSQDKKKTNVGANLFIGGLDADVDEKLLYDTFSAFGFITEPPKVRISHAHVCWGVYPGGTYCQLPQMLPAPPPSLPSTDVCRSRVPGYARPRNRVVARLRLCQLRQL